MRRRGFLLAGGSLAGPVALRAGAAGASTERPGLRVWRDPNCGCCGAWVAHMRAEGFQVEDSVVPSVAPMRRALGIPADLPSCHAGLVDGIALEGHVPAAAVKRVLADRPAGVRGLAVPGMPIGSPGMEVPGQPDEAFDVIAFGDGPHRPYMRFVGGRPD